MNTLIDEGMDFIATKDFTTGFNADVKSYQHKAHKQQREVLSIKQLAAIRKIQRLDYLLSSCASPISRRIMEVMDEVELPEERVEAAVGVLKWEQKVGRDSDFVRACLGSLSYCDEKDLTV